MKKDTCDGIRSISTQFLKKHGYFNEGWLSGTITWTNQYTKNSIGISTSIGENSSQLTLDYNWWREELEKVPMKYSIDLVTTHCFFGGKRWWFICPLTCNGVACRRRVGKLYIIGKWFGCRRCGDYAYDSQYERRSGYIGAMGHYLMLSAKLDETRRPRVRYWRGEATKRYRKYIQLNMRADGVAATFLNESKKMDAWIKKRKSVK